MTAVDDTPAAGIAQLPPPKTAPACQTCGGPARMALGVGRGPAGVGRDHLPRDVGTIHERVYFDWRQAPSFNAARFYCKRDGMAALALLAEMYVADDSDTVLDPEDGPADPHETFLTRMRDGGQP